MKTVALNLIVSILLITSCSKNTTTNNSIVGTWKLNNFNAVQIDSTTKPVTITASDTSFNLVITFNKEGSANSTDGGAGSYTLYDSDSISYVFGPAPTPVKARYTIEGSILTFFTSPHYLQDSFHYYITTQTYTRVK